MRVLLISNDVKLIELLRKQNVIGDNQLTLFNESADPLDVMSFVCARKGSLIIIDDDYLRPNTPHLLRSIKKVVEDIAIVFVSSCNSIELGKEITQIGVNFYAIKPVEENEFKELIHSLNKLMSNKTFNNP